MYARYFPKDMYWGTFSETGHRHEWASAVVWLDNPALEKPKILAVSTSQADGVYRIVKNGPPLCDRYSCAPRFTECINGTSPMLMVGETQDLIIWEQLTEEARGALSETDFGKKAKVPFIDANFNANLETSRPFL
ncbi:hypothetical protein PF011_g18607 [Phytophthora fragariae]|uniref:Uncharacterized protein n=1 Tax=Phytophthora fragariae TaxID=53985 RepID=A0A6A3J604_9STRA|nr:hypothetical protein PF011_g18607 [Phytophthora fragariae]